MRSKTLKSEITTRLRVYLSLISIKQFSVDWTETRVQYVAGNLNIFTDLHKNL